MSRFMTDEQLLDAIDEQNVLIDKLVSQNKDFEKRITNIETEIKKQKTCDLIQESKVVRIASQEEIYQLLTGRTSSWDFTL